MHLIIYEIIKIFTHKFIRILFLLLFLINMVFCITIAIQDNNKIPDEYWKNIMEIYRVSPQKVEEINKSLYEDVLKQAEAVMYAEGNGESELPIIMQFNYINYKNFTDFDLFGSFIEYRDNVENYQENLQIYINQAIRRKKDIEDMGNSRDSFSYDYQNKIISLYSKLSKELNVKFDYVYGWDRLFAYDGSTIFGFIAVLIIGCVAFSYDKNCGIDKIIKTTKKGKYSIIYGKIITVIILSAIISIMFSLLSFIIIGIFRGYSNPLNAIQLFSDYILCPFKVTFIEAYIISSLLRAASCIVFGLLVTFLSVFLNKYSVTLFGGTLLLWINYIISITNTSSQYKYLNLISISSIYDMLSRYRAISILNNVVSFFIIVIGVMIILILVCVIGIIFISSSYRFRQNIKISIFEGVVKYLKKFKLKIFNLNNTYRSYSIKKYSNSFLSWEFSKNIIFVFIFVLLLIIKIYNIYDEYSYKKSFSDDVYKEYMTYLAGSLTNEKLEYINKEFEYINSINNSISEMTKKYMSGKITFEEYEMFVEEYKYTYARSTVIIQVKERAAYLSEIKNTYGIEACFVYDTGILKIINRDFDIIMYIIIILFAGGIYNCEYNNKGSSSYFASLLRTTKNGRQKTFAAKSITALCAALCIYIIFSIIDFTAVISKYEIPSLNIPLMSIKSYENMASNISITKYLVIILFVSFVAVIMLSVIAVSISQLLKKPIPVYSAIVLFTLVPRVFINLDLTVCKYIDFTQFMIPDSLIKFSLDLNMFGKFGYMAVFLIIICSISMVLYKLSHKNYCGNYRK